MRTKQTPHGSSSSHRPRGMATATFTGTQREKPEDTTAGDESQDSQDWPDLDNPEGAVATQKGETSKTTGEVVQAEGEALAPPKENPPAPIPTDPKPATSQDPTDTPAVDPTQVPAVDPTQATAKDPDQDTPLVLTVYVQSYQKAGKAWLNTVLKDMDQAYDTLLNELLRVGNPDIENFPQADKQTVMKCIRDRTGRFLSEDDFAVYVERDEPPNKPKIKLQGEAKEALKDYYEAVHTLSEAQLNFMKSAQVLEDKLEDKEVFLDIIKQMQLPAVKVSVCTVVEMEAMQSKTYRELTLEQHLPNYKTIYPNASEQTRTLAAFVYYVLYEQITGLQKSQTGCSKEFQCQTTPFKRLMTGKKQPGGPSRTMKLRSGRTLEEVKEMEEEIPAKWRKVTPKSTHSKGRGKGTPKKK